MGAEQRDAQFVEVAVSSGVVDPSRARRLLEARALSPARAEPIEAFAVRAGLVTREEVERIVAHALGRGRVPQGAATFVGEPAAPAPGAQSQTYDPVLEARRRALSRTHLSQDGVPSTAPGSGSEVDGGPSSPGAATFAGLGPLPSHPGEATFAPEATFASFSGNLPANPEASFAAGSPATFAGERSHLAFGQEATVWSQDGQVPAIAREPFRASSVRPGIGRRLGPYELLGEIARGGMGVVYRARRDGEDRVVALKMLLDEANPSEVLTRRFKREIRAGLEIDHPNVVKVFDSGVIEGRLYFTMELVDGASLNDLLLKLDRNTKVALVEQVARAVHAAHEKGYIHRDLKPHNVLVSRDLVPKVADFGLAKSLDRMSRLTRTGAVLGTILYMAPEQATGGGDKLDRGCDIYSLGVMLYQALCGQVPFRDGATHQLIKQILTQDPPHPRASDPTCPADLAAVALKALEKDPAKRFPTALAFADELRAWMEGEQLSTAPVTLGSRLRRWTRRHRLLVSAVVGLVVIGGVAALATRVLYERAVHAKLEQERRELVAATEAADAVLARLAAPEPPLASLRPDLEGVEDRLEHFRALGTAPGNAAPRAALEDRRASLEGALAVARGEEPRAEDEARLAAAFARAPKRLDVRLAYAMALALGGKLEEERSVLAFPEARADALERLGACEVELEAWSDAARDYRSALALEPARSGARIGLARALVLDGRPDEAQKLLDARDATRQRDLDERIVLDEALAATDPGAAVADLRRLERANPKDAELARRTAALVLALGRAPEALASFDRAAALAPKDARCLVGRAEALALLGEVGKALDELDRAVEAAHPGSLLRARIRARRVRLLALSGDVSGAERVARKGLEEKPGDLELRLELALLAADRGDGGAAADLEGLASALGNRRAGTRARAARERIRLAALEKSGAKDEAARAVAGLETRPDDDDALALRASLLALAGSPDAGAALERANAAFASSGTSDGARFYRAAVTTSALATRFLLVEDRAHANALLSLALAAAPWSGKPGIERAARRLQEGEKPSAVRPDLERALALAGDDPAGLALLARVLLEEDETANGTRALDAVDRAIAHEGDRASLLALRSRALAALGRTADALAAVEESLAVDHTSAAVWEQAERLYAKLGRASDAARARREADDRTMPRRHELVMQAYERSDWRRATDLEPRDAHANYKAIAHIIYTLNNGGSSTSDDPYPYLGRAVEADPAILNDCAGSGSGLDTLRNFDIGGMAARYEEDASDRDALRTAATLRMIAILEALVDRKPVTDDLIAAARIDVERYAVRAPAEIAPVLAEGVLLSLERRADLAVPLLERSARYFPEAAICYYAWILAEAARGQRDVARALLKKLHPLDDDLEKRVMETPEVRALDH